MEFQEFISHFRGVRVAGRGQVTCLCPAHNDKNPSLSITDDGKGRILIHCFRNCKTEDVVKAAGLEMNDLFYGDNVKMQPAFPKAKSKQKPKPKTETQPDNQETEIPFAGEDPGQVVAEYDYFTVDGKKAFHKERVEYKKLRDNGKHEKKCFFYSYKGAKLVKGTGGKPIEDFKAIYGDLQAIRAAIDRGAPVFYAEGESCVQALQERGYAAFTCGSSENVWQGVTEAVFPPADVHDGKLIILSDNDEPGFKCAWSVYADTIGRSGLNVKIINPMPNMDKGDIADWFEQGHTTEDFENLITTKNDTGEVQRAARQLDKSKEPDIENAVVSLKSIEIKEMSWLVPGYMPKGQVTILAGAGGSGKTTIWCDIAAAISAGRKSVLSQEIPFEEVSGGQKVLYFSAEDSSEYVLKQRLLEAGGNADNLLTIDIGSEFFSRILFGSQELEALIMKFCPVLCIFDPIQAFLPDSVKMGDRNQMRHALESLIRFGTNYGTTFLIVVHANKREKAWGRDRIADSADIWDIARSVLMTGETTSNGVKYLTQEKSNYGQCGQTILFSSDGGRAEFKGHTTKKDRDFVLERTIANSPRTSSALEGAKSFILGFIDDGKPHDVHEVDEGAKAAGISDRTLRRAKEELQKAGRIKYRAAGFGKERHCTVEACADGSKQEP